MARRAASEPVPKVTAERRNPESDFTHRVVVQMSPGQGICSRDYPLYLSEGCSACLATSGSGGRPRLVD
jgi:hypothetical protein